jgi:HK97 family phage prohead protease
VARKLISTKEFRETYKPGDELPKDLLVCRAEPFSLHKEGSDAENLIKTFTISTSSVDREGDRLLANWELGNFSKGGSVLWAHDSRRTPEHVIAAPKATWQEGEALKSRAQFTPRDINPTGYMVYQLIDFGALRSSSVGFNPLEWKIIDDNSRWGYDFERIELLEWSVVPVPANPEALVDAKAHGIDIDPMTAWLEEVLDREIEIVGVSRDVLEATEKAITPVSVQVPADPPQQERPSMELTIDVKQVMETMDKLAALIGKLGEKVTALTEKLERATDETTTPAPTPRAQPATAPDEIEIDLSDPQVVKMIREETRDAADTAIRKLRGQLPD